MDNFCQENKYFWFKINLRSQNSRGIWKEIHKIGLFPTKYVSINDTFIFKKKYFAHHFRVSNTSKLYQGSWFIRLLFFEKIMNSFCHSKDFVCLLFGQSLLPNLMQNVKHWTFRQIKLSQTELRTRRIINKVRQMCSTNPNYLGQERESALQFKFWAKVKTTSSRLLFRLIPPFWHQNMEISRKKCLEVVVL